jgi:hypothetical protein
MATCVLLVRSQTKVAKMFLFTRHIFVCLHVRHKYRVPGPIFMKFGFAEFLDLMQP